MTTSWALLACAVLTACTTEEGGRALPADGPPATSAAGSTAIDPSAGMPPEQAPGTPVSTGAGPEGTQPSATEDATLIQLCGLLTAEEAASFGVDASAAESMPGRELASCRVPALESGGPTLLLGFSALKGLDPSTLPGDAVETQVGSRPALRSTEGNACDLTIALGPDAHALVRARSSEGTDTACALAEAVAGTVEPRLPHDPG
ncbi:DUF3558 family protein [Actinoalloteichus spitiensis]|uniref:DUF3558 family protein n=1 Tax=Actinoalloteichus spitiensis TaxID=252394 RepID=UPI00035DC566|nr:DUF3558 family protein [Actinoalloteichus spitiensis]